MAEHSGHWQDGRLAVVINDDGAWSIWPEDRKRPAGWKDAGFTGLKAACLAHIAAHWTNLKPAGLLEIDSIPAVAEAPGGERLVDRLTAGRHAVSVAGSGDGAVGFRRALERGYVHVSLPGLPGSSLGLHVGPGDLDLREADFENATGRITFSGRCILDGSLLECRAGILLPALAGDAVFEISGPQTTFFRSFRSPQLPERPAVAGNGA